MKITLNFEVNSLPKKNGTYPIFLRATENGRHFKQALDVYVTDRKNFDAKAKRENWISTKEPYAKVFNSRLSSSLEQAHKTMLELERREELSAQNLIKILKGDNSDSFVTFIDCKIKQYQDKRQLSTSLSTEYFKKKLLDYNRGKDVLFRDLTYPYINGFVTFLTKYVQVTGEHLSQNTIHSTVARFKTLYRQAISEGLIVAQSNPFDKIKVKKGNTHRIGLTKNEVDKIINLNLEERSPLWHTRNYFLFSMYMAGMRISDVMNLKWENVIDDRLFYQMQKTKSPRSIPIVEQANTILELYRDEKSKPSDYVFPILTRYKQRNATDMQRHKQRTARLSTINTHLKKIANMAEIDKNLSFHIARHTFAHIASESPDGNVFMISQLLGHSSISITQTYLNGLNHKHQDEFLKRIFDL